MRQRLLWKLLLVTTVPVIIVIIGVVWIAIDQLAADYFMVLMNKYMVAPTETHQMFLTAIHRYLLWASLAALALAVLFSYLLTRRVLRPLSQMAEASRQFADGNFASRVEVTSQDEVGQVGVAFNRMADGLEEIERLRKTMVADVAHELRTPLTNLRGYLEGLSDGVLPPKQETFTMLLNEILRLVHLVEDLGQLARAEAARTYLDRQPVNLPESIDRMLLLYRPNLESKQIRLSTDYDKEAANLSADPDKLLQAIRNLLENAWKYSPEGGELAVCTEKVGNSVRVTFSNSGTPIPSSELPLIFERFYRVDPSRSRDAGGAGIGLAIVRELIEAHGGRVGAESDASGTRIWFELPLR
jgi:signal transduction histidine kinase